MSDQAFDAQLRGAAQRFLDQGAEGAQREYLGLTFELVERSVRRALGDTAVQSRGSVDLTTDEAVVPVLDKCLDQGFVRRLAEADTPSRFLRVSAYRATLDLLRASRPRIVLAKSDRDASDNASAPEDEGAEETRDLLKRTDEVLDALPDDKRVLLDAVLGRFDERDVGWLAAKRNISQDEARVALQSRCKEVRGAREEQESILTGRLDRLSMLQERLEIVRSLLRERDIVPLPRREGVDADDDLRWPSSPAKLRTHDDDWLKKQEDALARGVLRWTRLVAEAQKDVGKPLGTQPGWRDIAILLGRIAADAAEKELADAQNLTQQHVKRLLKKLGDQLGGMEDNDG